jgi:peptidoglycan/LPS O-acetylase OafA/YrhL
MRYAKARFLRVVPAYWAQVALILVFSWITMGAPPEWAKRLPIHLLMLHNINADMSWDINPVYWTLPIEMNFYLALPFLVRFVAAKGMAPGVLLRRTLAMLAAVIGIAILYRVAIFAIYKDSVREIIWAVLQLPGSLDQFALGMLAAVLFRGAKSNPRLSSPAAVERLSLLLLLVGMTGAIAMMHWIHHTPDYWSGSRLPYFWYTATSAFLAMAVLSIALSSRLTRFLFENGPVVWLGTISYSIYLWHYPVSKWVATNLGGAAMDRIEFGLAAFAATVAVSAVSYYAVERPFMRWGAGARPLGARMKPTPKAS